MDSDVAADGRPVKEFDLSELDAGDESTLAIKNAAGKPTTWIWTFYGPGHPKTVALSNRVSKKWLQEAREKEQAQVNNKKWKAEERSLDDVRNENVDSILERTKDFTPVKLNGEVIEFSPDAARRLLLDPRKGALFTQISEFLKEESSFMRPSAKS
jgi:hypothetical protein